MALWAVMAICVAAGVILEKKFRWAARISALVLILLSAILLSNAHVIPDSAQMYDLVWDYLVPLTLPMLLFRADLKRICRESGQMLLAFLLGAAGTVVGSLVAYTVFRGLIHELGGLAAMMTGTYIGGSVNFAALSAVFGVSGEMISSATIADNLNMAVYILILLSIPVRCRAEKDDALKVKTAEKRRKDFSLAQLATGLAAAFLVVSLSKQAADMADTLLPSGTILWDVLHSLAGNTYLWITTLSVLCATLWPSVFGNLSGMQELGMYGIYCFMFVVGAPASVMGIIKKAPLLLLFAMLIVCFNMLFTFAGGKLFRIDREVLIIASNANIGGPTTAASMAIARKWEDLVAPALLIGSFGYVIGNYLGMIVGFVLT